MPAARAAASVHNVRAAARPSRAAARRPQRAAPAGAAGEGRGEDEAAHAAGGGVGGGLSAALESLEAAADAGMLDANAMGELAGIVGAAGDGAVGAAQTNASEAAPRTACQAFHLAIPVHDIEAARAFYGPGGALGLAEGRRSARWQDYDLFGHQLVLHQVDGYEGAAAQSGVDGDPVPVPHFGLALSTGAFHALAARVAASGVTFEVAPHVRFAGQAGEQWTMFFRDCSGNALEFKAMAHPENLFARYDVDEADGRRAEREGGG